MIPRHPPRALSSLTYINFHTRLKYQRVVTFPYSIVNVHGTLSLPCTAGSLRSPARRPASQVDAPHSCGPHHLERSNVACLRLSIATGSGQRNRPDVCRPVRGLSSGAISLFDCADRVPHQCCIARVLFAFLAVGRRRSLLLPGLSPQATMVGGAEEARTPDPLLAKEVLSQLSYGPPVRAASEWWGILDSNQRPQSYQDCALTS